jgi:uncharacterized protein YndB with AHSA1/START domain
MGTMDKTKLELEYVVNCSPKMLFTRLSTASGLGEWFADDVTVRGKKYTFTWDKASQTAELVFQKENYLVRFQWEDEDGYFEFKITRDELTGDVSLHVVDFVDPDEKDESRSLWDSQIYNLKKLIGS